MKKIFFKNFFIYLFLFFIFFSPLSYALISISEEERIGKEVFQILSSRVRFVEDIELVGYLNLVGNLLITKGVRASPFRFKFFLIKDDTFNAFSLPGGYIFVNTGIFENIDAEDQLAGIIAHEMAHNLCRHIARRFEEIKKMQTVITTATIATLLLGGGKIGEAVGITSTALAQTRLLAYSRADEEEADRTGFEILTKAGYSPWGMVELMEKLAQQNKLAIELNYRYLLTHPLPRERLDYILALAEKYKSVDKPKYIISSDPFYFKRLCIKAQILSKEPADLILKYREMLKKSDDPWVRYSLALTLAKERFFKEAIEEMRKALKGLPPRPYFLLDLAEVYFNCGKYEEALNILKKIKIDRNSKKLYENLYYLKVEYLKGIVFSQINCPSKAYSIFTYLKEKRIFNRDPYFYFYFGRICGKINKDGEAHFYFGKYYELKGDYTTALYHYRKALSFLDKKDKMYEEVEKAKKRLQFK